MKAFNLRASSFEEFAIVDAGRAGGHAGHAAETGVEVLDPGGRDLGGAFSSGFDEVNAAAGRVHFFVPEDVGRTGGEAEAAVNALVKNFGGGRMVDVEGGESRW